MVKNTEELKKNLENQEYAKTVEQPQQKHTNGQIKTTTILKTKKTGYVYAADAIEKWTGKHQTFANAETYTIQKECAENAGVNNTIKNITTTQKKNKKEKNITKITTKKEQKAHLFIK